MTYQQILTLWKVINILGMRIGAFPLCRALSKIMCNMDSIQKHRDYRILVFETEAVFGCNQVLDNLAYFSGRPYKILSCLVNGGGKCQYIRVRIQSEHTRRGWRQCCQMVSIQDKVRHCYLVWYQIFVSSQRDPCFNNRVLQYCL